MDTKSLGVSRTRHGKIITAFTKPLEEILDEDESWERHTKYTRFRKSTFVLV